MITTTYMLGYMNYAPILQNLEYIKYEIELSCISNNTTMKQHTRHY